MVIDRVNAAKLFLNLITSRRKETLDPENFDTSALSSLSVISSSQGHVVCTLPVTPSVTNRYKTLHGGCIGEILEDTATFAQYSFPFAMNSN